MKFHHPRCCTFPRARICLVAISLRIGHVWWIYRCSLRDLQNFHQQIREMKREANSWFLFFVHRHTYCQLTERNSFPRQTLKSSLRVLWSSNRQWWLRQSDNPTRQLQTTPFPVILKNVLDNFARVIIILENSHFTSSFSTVNSISSWTAFVATSIRYLWMLSCSQVDTILRNWTPSDAWAIRFNWCSCFLSFVSLIVVSLLMSLSSIKLG